LSNPLLLIGFGIVVGVFSGVMGLGGGSVMIPMMVLALGMSQTQAHGTSLAVMIPPVTLPAVIEYYRTGNVNLHVALWMALGVLCGTFFGALIATHLPKDALKLVFGFVLIYVAAYTIFGREHLTRTLVLSLALVLIGVAMVMVTRWVDRSATTSHASDSVFIKS
jgi:uncharacterized membrane protein YfcA